MKGPVACDACDSRTFRVYLGPSGSIVLECARCRARTGFRAHGPVMADAS